MAAKRVLLVSLMLFLFLLGAQTPPGDLPRILSPLPDSPVQGTLTVTGSTDLPGFDYAELSFSYTGAQPESWFLIQQLRTPVKEGPLAMWDTTTIADGNYRLRLQVFFSGGKVVETFTGGLRVRNYTPVETSTPTTIRAVDIRPAASATPPPASPTPRSTPTALLPNPAQVPPESLFTSLGWGAGAVVLLFILLAFYQAAHNQGKPR
jgi:hypothetical protein